MKSVVFLVATAATSVSASVLLPRAGCNADNCLRGVRATQHGDRGYNDCLSYWRTTYTPSVSTEYTTVIIPTTTASTDSITLTTTILDTLTTLTPTTITETIPTTFTETKTLNNGGSQINKRNCVVQHGNTIPTYASFCSGTSRYSSACSCLGVSTIFTVTAPAPTTTETITATSTVTTPTSITIKTESITTTDATVTLPSTSKTTVTTGPSETVIAFALQVVGPPQFANQYLRAYEYSGPTAIGLRLTTDRSLASTIYLHPNKENRISIRTTYSPGILWAIALAPPSTNSITFRVEAEVEDPSFGPLLCTIGDAPARTFACTYIYGWNTLALWVATGSLGFIENPAAATSDWAVVTLKAIPLL
ncbi:hypothetical protein TWF569_008154 [Orbilia oligospora]|uniref:CBM1 domain-containing protein n=1 Tax=Orbilia oligospora TaxID=2813651 RepID=A0A7C8N273_ORBOL|nr:hypothetical protein TWF102_003569 [Orbilia oligospora]KAF3080048.1 hypothetical protein TWF706_003034 [Orbilia oligospora]KAF3093253.1 hypothetical protein TWF103_011009 [Orbilia oligospora]KAF3118967.1 hypothetical protein TWF594_005391 [Orbilia oligospora]KAF3140837.1 hypothetical protein TWF569_008154 [Orbilia oligospora]